MPVCATYAHTKLSTYINALLEQHKCHHPSIKSVADPRYTVDITKN